MAETRIDRRVAKLERTCRRQAAALWGMGLLACTVALAGAQRGPGTVTATGLRIVDDAGRTRAGLSVVPDGVMFYLKDEGGDDRVSLYAQRTGAEVAVLGTSDRAARLMYQADMGCRVTVAGPDGRTVAVMPPPRK